MRRLLSLTVALLFSLPALSQSVSFNMIQMGPSGGPVVGDFNGDGREDMIVLSGTSGSTSSFHVLISTGTGTYTSAMSYTVPSGGTANGNISSYTSGDFNGDGKLDLAIVTGGPNQTGQPYLYT